MNDDLTHARGWLGKADSDLQAAQRLLESGGPYDAACFHAQQAVEKSLKAVLALHDVVIPRTHDLTELARLVEHAFPGVAVDDGIADLTAFSVELRYDFEFWPDVDTVRRAVAMAGEIRALVGGLIVPAEG